MNNRETLVVGDVVLYKLGLELEEQSELNSSQSQQSNQNSQASSSTCTQSAGWRFKSSRAVVIACGVIHENYLDSEYCIEMKVCLCTIYFGPFSSITFEFRQFAGRQEEEQSVYCQAHGY